MLYRHPKMNVISRFIMLVVLASCCHFSEELRWVTNERNISACKGQTLDLSWEFDAEGKEIRSLEWYFNKSILICSATSKDGFIIRSLHLDRIERSGTSGIRLKNISISDEGTYTLLPVFFWYTSESTQSIALQVSEPPRNTCMGNIHLWRNSSRLSCDFSSSECGRPQMSVVWKRCQMCEVMGEGNSIELDLSFSNKEIICCPQGKAMDCVDDFTPAFCVPLPVSTNNSPSETSINTLQNNPATSQVPQSYDKDGSEPDYLNILISLVIFVLLVTIIAAVSFYLIWRRMMNLEQIMKELPEEMQKMHKDTDAPYKDETVQLLAVKEAKHSTPAPTDDTEDKSRKANTECQPSTDQEIVRMGQERHDVNPPMITYDKHQIQMFLQCSHFVASPSHNLPFQTCPACTVQINK